jgi:hypothetical protein
VFDERAVNRLDFTIYKRLMLRPSRWGNVRHVAATENCFGVLAIHSVLTRRPNIVSCSCRLVTDYSIRPNRDHHGIGNAEFIDAVQPMKLPKRIMTPQTLRLVG